MLIRNYSPSITGSSSKTTVGNTTLNTTGSWFSDNINRCTAFGIRVAYSCMAKAGYIHILLCACCRHPLEIAQLHGLLFSSHAVKDQTDSQRSSSSRGWSTRDGWGLAMGVSICCSSTTRVHVATSKVIFIFLYWWYRNRVVFLAVSCSYWGDCMSICIHVAYTIGCFIPVYHVMT